MESIRVAVHGALGRMGQEVINALCHEPNMQIVGAVDLKAAGDYLPLPDGSGTVPFSSNLDYILTDCQPDVLVDFTTAQATMPAVRVTTEQGVNLVIGTTGLTADDINEIDRLAEAHQVGAIVAPNFALGAVLMIHLAKVAAKYLDYAEIIELHHHLKADAPSGTALATAKQWHQPEVNHSSPPHNKGRPQIAGESKLKVLPFIVCVYPVSWHTKRCSWEDQDKH